MNELLSFENASPERPSHGRWFRKNDQIILYLGDEHAADPYEYEQEVGGGETDRTATEAFGIRVAIEEGQTDETRLTDLVFNARHRERQGRPIQANEAALRREWLDIRNRLVRPALHPSAPLIPPPGPFPSIFPTYPWPASESGRFAKALTKLESLVKGTSDPRNWRYQCWFQKLKNPRVDDRLIKWSTICPSAGGSVAPRILIGACDITQGWPMDQALLQNKVHSVADVDSVGQSLGIITFLKTDIVISEEMTSAALVNLQMVHDNVQKAIDNLGKWADVGLGGSSSMPKAYVAIKDWIGQRQRDSNSLYSCM